MNHECRILSLVYYEDLGLYIWVGDDMIDGKACGFNPTEEFVEACRSEILHHIKDTVIFKEPVLAKAFKATMV